MGGNAFYYRNMLLIYQYMLLFFEKQYNMDLTYMPKISKKEHIYSISVYYVMMASTYLVFTIYIFLNIS